MLKIKIYALIISSFLVLTACSSPDEQVGHYVTKAKEYIENGDYEAAHIEYRNALQINPNHVEALYGVTKVFDKKGEWRNVYRYLERVLELDPSHVDSIVTLGSFELAAGKLDKAMGRSEAALEIAPEVAKVIAFNAVVRLKLGDTEGAVSAAKSALIKEPKNLEAILVLAAERMEVEEFDQALAYLNQAEVGSPLLQAMKVQVFNSQKNLQGAVSVFEEMIKAAPENDEHYFSLAKQYLMYGKTEEAEGVLKDLVSLKSDSIDAKIRYAHFLYQYMGIGRSVAQYKLFIEENPKNLKLNFSLADTYLKGGFKDEAKKILLQISEFDNSAGRVSALNKLTKIEFGDGDFEQGDVYLATVLSEDPGNQEATVTHAQRILQKGEIENAIAMLRTVLRDAPNSAVVLTILGKAHEQQGKVELALDQYAKAYASEPDSQLAVVAYAELLISERNYRQADQVLGRYLRTAPSDIAVLKLAAQTKLMLRDWPAAEAFADRLDLLKADASYAEQVRGSAFLGRDDYQQGVTAFERAYEAAEDKAKPMIALVRSYIAAKQADKAHDFLVSVLEYDKDNLTALMLMAQLHRLNADVVEEEAVLRQAVKSNPQSIETYRQLSGLLMRESRVVEAFDVVNQGVVALPENESLLFLKASLNEVQGDYAAAIETYEQILAFNPDFNIATNNLAVILSENENFLDLERAKDLAMRFRQSKIPYYQDTLGRIYYLTGDFNNALYFHENAVKAMPEFAEFRYHLALAYKASGKLGEAKSQLETALNLVKDESPSWKDEAMKILGGL